MKNINAILSNENENDINVFPDAPYDSSDDELNDIIETEFLPDPDFDTIMPQIQEELESLGEFFEDRLNFAMINSIHSMPVITKNPLTTEIFTITDNKITTLVDSGADCSLLSHSTFLSLPPECYSNSDKDLKLYDVQHSEIEQLRNPIDLHLNIGKEEISHTFHIVERGNIIGLDFLQRHSVSILNKDNSTKLQMELNSDEKSLEDKGSIKAVSKLAFLDHLEVPPGISSVKGSCNLNNGVYNLDSQKGNAICFPEAVHVVDHTFETCIENRTISSINVTQDQAVGNMEEIENYPPRFPIPEEEAIKDLEDIEPRAEAIIGQEVLEYDWEADLLKFDHIPEHLLKDFISFVKKECSSLISTSPYDYGKLHPKYGIKLKVTLKPDAAPKRQRAFHLDPVRQRALDEHLNRLLEKGLYTRTTDAEWGSPIFLIPKRDKKTWRYLVDTRHINSQSKVPSYPIKDPSCIIESLTEHGVTFFTCMDLRNCFDCLEIDPDSRRYLVILTKETALCPLRAPQGYCGTPAHWTRAMNEIACEIRAKLPKGTSCEFFYDDLTLSTSGSIQEHLSVVKIVFSVLQEAGLKLNCAKLQLCQTKVELLGKIIDRLGVSPNPRHYVAIEKFPRPTNVKQIMSFLGTLNFLSNCIFNFSKIVLPLVRLLKKGTPFHWTQEHENSFLEIKKAVVNAIKIYHTQYNEPAYIIHDSSKYHWSGLIYQIKSYSINEIENLRSEVYYNELFTSKKGSQLTPHPVLIPKAMARKVDRNSIVLSPIAKAINHERSMKAKELRKLKEEIVEGDKNTDTPSLNLPPSVNLLTEKLEHASNVTAYLQQGNMVHLIFPIAVKSGTMTQTQIHWSSLEHEAFGMFQIANKFAQILTICSKAIFITDCLALVYLSRIIRTQQNPPSKLCRWFLKFSSLPFVSILHHVAGSQNPVDLLSRPYGSLAFKLDESKKDKLTAITVVSPFKFGTVVTLEEIDAYVTEMLSDGKVPAPYRMDPNDKHIRSVKVKPMATVSTITVETTKPLAELFEPANIRQEQLLDTHTRELFDNPEKPDNIVVLKGLLYKLVKIAGLDELQPRIYLPESLHLPIFSLLHWGSHLNSRALFALCASMYYFKKMLITSTKFTSSCYLCQISKVNTHSLTKLLPTSFDASPRNFSWAIDIVNGFSPHRSSDNVLIMMERSTRFTIATWVPKATGQVIRRIIEEKLISLFTPPYTMSSDQGSNLLLNKNVSEMLGYYGITTSVSTPYASFAHGSIERRNLVFSDLLRILTKQFNKSWYQLLPQINLFMNLSPLDCLGGLTPAYAFIGSEINHLKPITDQQVQDPEALQSFWKMLDKVVASRSEPYNKRNEKQRENSKGRVRRYPPGSFVYYKKMAKEAHSKHKSRYFLAPMMILSEWQNTILVKKFDGTTQYIHKRFVKPSHERTVKMYSRLPLKSRFAMGDIISHEILRSYIDSNELPEFFTDPKPFARRRPVTRLVSPRSKPLDFPLTELSESDLFVDDNLAEEYSSDDEDQDEISIDPQAQSKSVQFAA